MDYDTFLILKSAYEEPKLAISPTEEDIQQSIDAYTSLSEKLQKLLSTNSYGSENINTLRRLMGSVNEHFRSCVVPGRIERPILPILLSDTVKDYFARLSSLASQVAAHEKRLLVTQIYAAYLYEVKDIWLTNETISTPNLPPNILAEFNNYSTWNIGHASKQSEADVFGMRRDERKRLQFLETGIEQILKTQQDRIGTLSAVLDEETKRFNETIQRLNIENVATKSKVDDTKEMLKGTGEHLVSLLQSVNTAEGSVQAFAKAVREELKIDTTKKLWDQRAINSTWAFWLSAITIAVTIFYPPYWAFHHLDDVISILRKIGDAAVQGLPADASAAQLTAATISRLVVISAPLALYFWAIKLMIRFNTRSMILMDDARQRQTTMDTYFHLVEKDKATPEERGLMLNALFKPLPGQGQENVEPPSFLDLTKRPE